MGDLRLTIGRTIRSHYSSAYSENPASRPAPGIFSNNDDNAFRDYNVVQLDKCAMNLLKMWADV